MTLDAGFKQDGILVVSMNLTARRVPDDADGAVDDITRDSPHCPA